MYVSGRCIHPVIVDPVRLIRPPPSLTLTGLSQILLTPADRCQERRAAREDDRRRIERICEDMLPETLPIRTAWLREELRRRDENFEVSAVEHCPNLRLTSWVGHARVGRGQDQGDGWPDGVAAKARRAERGESARAGAQAPARGAVEEAASEVGQVGVATWTCSFDAPAVLVLRQTSI